MILNKNTFPACFFQIILMTYDLKTPFNQGDKWLYDVTGHMHYIVFKKLKILSAKTLPSLYLDSWVHPAI